MVPSRSGKSRPAAASELRAVLGEGAGAPSGRGVVTGDPAASSATPHADSQTTGTATRSNPGGSGTSTSGRRDDNGDAGRDKMPESNRTVRPASEQHHPE